MKYESAAMEILMLEEDVVRTSDGKVDVDDLGGNGGEGWPGNN
mgnify:CR=1 FL=1